MKVLQPWQVKILANIILEELKQALATAEHALNYMPEFSSVCDEIGKCIEAVKFELEHAHVVSEIYHEHLEWVRELEKQQGPQAFAPSKGLTDPRYQGD